MNSRILFLDYDGVVNTPMWNERGTKVSYGFPEDGKVNNFQAVQWVSEFCQKCKFDLVITSSRREKKNYRECLTSDGLRKNIVIAAYVKISVYDTIKAKPSPNGNGFAFTLFGEVDVNYPNTVFPVKDGFGFVIRLKHL